MIIIHVKHFLNDEGLKNFDTWFEECYAYLSKQNGFYSLQRAFDNINQGTVHIWLHFENREKMQVWGNSNEHAALIAELDPYRIQSWTATWYDTEKACVEEFIIPLGKHTA